MLFRTACMTASVAALAFPALADNPRPELQPIGGATKIEPLRVRSYTIVDGRMVWTSDWMNYGGASPRATWVAAWDAAEIDLTGGVFGLPTDAAPGCAWRIAVGSRWFGGVTYNNPFVSNDITTDAAGQGQQCTAAAIEWYWNVGDAEPDLENAAGTGTPDGIPDAPCFIALQTFEDMNVSLAEADVCTGTEAEFDDGSGFLNGVIYDFGRLNRGNGYYYTTTDLSATGLFHQMPGDGDGGYQLIFAIENDGAGNLTIPTGIDGGTLLGVAAQPMSWGNGEDEVDAGGLPQPDGRPGSQDVGQYDDDAPTDGDHTYDISNPGCPIWTELYNYAAAGLCPEVLGSAVAFYYKAGGNPCPCVGDLDGDGDRDIADLSSFLSQFGQTGDPGSLGCADTNGDGAIDIGDLGAFLSVFGVPC